MQYIECKADEMAKLSTAIVGRGTIRHRLAWTEAWDPFYRHIYAWAAAGSTFIKLNRFNYGNNGVGVP